MSGNRNVNNCKLNNVYNASYIIPEYNNVSLWKGGKEMLQIPSRIHFPSTPYGLLSFLSFSPNRLRYKLEYSTRAWSSASSWEALFILQGILFFISSHSYTKMFRIAEIVGVSLAGCPDPERARNDKLQHFFLLN